MVVAQEMQNHSPCFCWPIRAATSAGKERKECQGRRLRHSVYPWWCSFWCISSPDGCPLQFRHFPLTQLHCLFSSRVKGGLHWPFLSLSRQARLLPADNKPLTVSSPLPKSPGKRGNAHSCISGKSTPFWKSSQQTDREIIPPSLTIRFYMPHPHVDGFSGIPLTCLLLAHIHCSRDNDSETIKTWNPQEWSPLPPIDHRCHNWY